MSGPVLHMGALTTTFAPFEAADYLDSEATIDEYLTAAAEDPNSDVFLAALSDVAEARGMTDPDAESGRA